LACEKEKEKKKEKQQKTGRKTKRRINKNRKGKRKKKGQTLVGYPDMECTANRPALSVVKGDCKYSNVRNTKR
jgi:hypothetical protein